MFRHRYPQSFVFWFFAFLVFLHIASTYWVEILIGVAVIVLVCWLCIRADP